MVRLAYDLADWLKAVSDDLESEVIARFGSGYDDLHPAMKRRFTRDMQPVVQARALLRHVRDVIPDWPRPDEAPADPKDLEGVTA
ncbi:MAG: hypothetical protein ACRDL7_00205 [Gaiellaceae bacterium]